MQAVMYHYVRPATDRPPAGYYHLPLERFRAQLDHLSERRTFLSKATFSEVLAGERTPPEDGVVLTFDDALVDHHEWVLPELQRRNLWGVFFVPTAPVLDGRRLAVHRVHALVASYPGDELLSALLELLRADEALSVPRSSDASAYAGRDTAASVRRFKQLLNWELPYDRLPDVLDGLEARFPETGLDRADDLYLVPEQLRELSAAGMVIGAHSVSHPVLSRLSAAEQREEVRASRRRLAEHLDADVDLFAYPYGGAETYTATTTQAVADAGFDAAFTTESGRVTPSDVAASPLELPRVDCTALPHGESAADLPGTH